jgi:hypothetical protein
MSILFAVAFFFAALAGRRRITKVLREFMARLDNATAGLIVARGSHVRTRAPHFRG